MTWALITDVHANRQAFEAVTADATAKGATRWALLGDFVGYGADPAWIVDAVMHLAEAGAVVVQGNHDAAVAAVGNSGMHGDARAVVDWTRAQLSAEQIAWLATLPLTVARDRVLFAHANAYAPGEWDYVQGRVEASRSLQAGGTARWQFCGHMHEPNLFHLSGTGKAGQFTPVAGARIPLPANRQWLAIPGSCGQPRDGDPAACYALFEPPSEASADAHLSFERVPYDVDAAVAALRASSLPGAVAGRQAQRLLSGE